MAITISHPLLPVHFSRNPIDVEFNCPEKYTSVGVFYRLLMMFSTFPVNDGNTLTYSYVKNGATIARTWTFRTTPNPDLYEILRYPGTGLQAWLENHVIPGIQGDADIAQDFMITLHVGAPIFGVIMRALFYESEEGIFSAVGFAVVNSLPSSGSIPVAEPFYRFSAWLFIGRNTESTSGLDRTGEMELDADMAGKVRLNLEKYADDLLDQVEPFTMSVAGPVLCTLINRPAYLLYGQKWGIIMERKKNFKSPTFRILKGGMPPVDFAREKADLADYLTGRFLTLRTSRLVRRTEHRDWLYWYCEKNANSVTLRGDTLTATGFTYSFDVWTSGPVKAGRTYQFRADPYFLTGLPGNWGEAVKYRLKLDGLTSYVEFFMDEDHLDIIFYFENTFGAIESMKFKGSRSAIATLTKVGYRKALPFNHGPNDTDLHSFGELVGQTLVCNTGPLNASEAKAMADFFRTRHRWLYISDTIQIPARILGGDVLTENLNLEGNYARGMDFTVELGVSKGV